ncbi:MAG TPA: TonB-dependent receptor [Steroidobacteraceae bacterium]|nr:TonB-dependent receptor [Steroidobacteraceae bacterium]
MPLGCKAALEFNERCFSSGEHPQNRLGSSLQILRSAGCAISSYSPRYRDRSHALSARFNCYRLPGVLTACTVAALLPGMSYVFRRFRLTLLTLTHLCSLGSDHQTKKREAGGDGVSKLTYGNGRAWRAKRRLARGICVTTALTALFSSAYAQDSTTSDSSIDSGKQVHVSQKSGNASDSGTLSEITVTATRVSERLSRVAASVTAFDQTKLDQEGVRSMDDVSRLAPGVTFTNTSYGGRTDIAIRGIGSQVGASTTGVYIDDTPVQVRNIGQSTNPYPEIFDLQRIEVLRGPQGTLFGAGSEGGAIRFITPQPSLNRYTGYSRAEASVTEHGDPSWEAGFAIGGPLLEDKLGFRVSAWGRRTGGYIDRVSNIDYHLTDKNANYRDAVVTRLALGLAPTEWLMVTPSVLYQKTDDHDTSLFNERISDPKEGKFLRPDPLYAPVHDKFLLSALNVQASLDRFTLTSVTSYFDRQGKARADFSLTLPQLILGPQVLADKLYLERLPQYTLASDYPTKQQIFTQEVRLQTADPNARLTGILGIFVQRSMQQGTQVFDDPMLPDLVAAYFGGLPVEAIFRTPMTTPTQSYIAMDKAHDNQNAIFGELTYRVVDKLKITAGARYAQTSFEFNSFQAGPWAGTPGLSATGTQREKPFTPKFGLTYSLDDSNLVYVTASKGFRVGGANKPIPVTTDACRADLAAFGLTQLIGPYRSDSVWSYEVGTKSSGLFGGNVQLFTSGYYLKWSDIQQSLPLPGCGAFFVGNLGSAVSTGADVQLAVRVNRHFQLGGAVAYNDTYYDKTLFGPAGPTGAPAILVDKGNAVGGAPWTVTLTPDYNREMFGKQGYARATFTYSSGPHRNLPAQDQNTLSYDPQAFQRGATHMVNLRAGLRDERFDVSLFVNNVFDSASILYRTNFAAGLPVFVNTTFTPRTIGLTGTYSF